VNTKINARTGHATRRRRVRVACQRAAAAAATAGTTLVLSASTALAQTNAPNPAPQAPPGLDAAADTFLGWMKWGGLIAGILGLFISGVMMMVGRRNRSTTAVDGATGIPWVLGGLTTVSFASAIVGAVLT
jgi:hypothetical protein